MEKAANTTSSCLSGMDASHCSTSPPPFVLRLNPRRAFFQLRETSCERNLPESESPSPPVSRSDGLIGLMGDEGAGWASPRSSGASHISSPLSSPGATQALASPPARAAAKFVPGQGAESSHQHVTGAKPASTPRLQRTAIGSAESFPGAVALVVPRFGQLPFSGSPRSLHQQQQQQQLQPAASRTLSASALKCFASDSALRLPSPTPTLADSAAGAAAGAAASALASASPRSHHTQQRTSHLSSLAAAGAQITRCASPRHYCGEDYELDQDALAFAHAMQHGPTLAKASSVSFNATLQSARLAKAAQRKSGGAAVREWLT
jgi:hypothetical protein